MVCPITQGDHKKIEEDRKKLQGKNIMSASATQGGHKHDENVMVCPITQGDYKEERRRKIETAGQNQMAVLCGMPTIQYSAKKRV